MAAPLGTYIQNAFPQATPATIALFTLPGVLCIAESAALIAALGIFPPLMSPPSLFRMQGTVSGTQFSVSKYSGYDFVTALSVGFDAVQIVVAPQLQIPISPNPPDEVTLQAVISAAFMTSVAATKPDAIGSIGIPPFAANLQLVFNAMAKFLRGLYGV